MAARFEDIRLDTEGGFGGADSGYRFAAHFPLFLIREAWERRCDFEDLADGFGAGLGTAGGDWSGIRDATPRATERMLERALNHLFGMSIRAAPVRAPVARGMRRPMRRTAEHV